MVVIILSRARKAPNPTYIFTNSSLDRLEIRFFKRSIANTPTAHLMKLDVDSTLILYLLDEKQQQTLQQEENDQRGFQFEVTLQRHGD